MNTVQLARLLGRNDELNALVEDKKRLKPSEREAIAAAQNALMLAAKELEALRAYQEPFAFMLRSDYEAFRDDPYTITARVWNVHPANVECVPLFLEIVI